MDDCAWSKIFGSVVSTVSLREVAGAGMLEIVEVVPVRFQTRRVLALNRLFGSDCGHVRWPTMSTDATRFRAGSSKFPICSHLSDPPRCPALQTEKFPIYPTLELIMDK